VNTIQPEQEKLQTDSTLPKKKRVPLAYDAPPCQLEDREFRILRKIVQDNTGIFLRDGRQQMLAARLFKRLRHLGIPCFKEYCTYLDTLVDKKSELTELVNAVTTNKTSFFRENHHFDYLARTIFEEKRQAALRGEKRELRIWCAASSTGEEPYSIAITLFDAISGITQVKKPETIQHMPSLQSWSVEIDASDIDTTVLATAKRGIYRLADMNEVSQDRMKRYFLRGKDEMEGYAKIKPQVSKLIHYQRINLIDRTWPIKEGLDAIFFRNALIYFQKETQEMILRRMAALLRPRGYLILGNSEHIPWLQDLVEPLQKTMYRLREGVNEKH